MATRRGAIGGLLLAFALIAGACGDDEGATTSTPPATTELTTSTGTPSATPEGDGATTAVDEERFCEVATAFEQSENPFELPQEQARIAIPNKQAMMAEAVLVAPDEIRTEVETMVEAFQPIFDLFEAADFDAAQIDPDDFTAIADTAYSGASATAGQIMDDWIAINCAE